MPEGEGAFSPLSRGSVPATEHGHAARPACTLARSVPVRHSDRLTFRPANRGVLVEHADREYDLVADRHDDGIDGDLDVEWAVLTMVRIPLERSARWIMTVPTRH